MTITYFASTRDMEPKRSSLVPRDFEVALPPHETHAQKHEARLFSPAEWLPGDDRTRGPVLVHSLVLDFDAVEREVAERTLVAVGSYAGLVYSTWSHALHEGERAPYFFRAVLPLARPVDANNWAPTFDRLVSRLGLASATDPRNRDPRRCYFVPSALWGATRKIYECRTGPLLDPATHLRVIP